MKRVYIADETLKVLSRERRAPLLFREKTDLVKGLVAAGLDAVELPEYTGQREEEILIKTLAPLVKDCRLCLPVSREADMPGAVHCLSAAAHYRLQVAFPASAVLLEYRLGLKEEKALVKLAALLKAAVSAAETELVLWDATGASEEFLLAACRTAEECGVAVLTLSDDAGQASPAETAALVRTVVSNTHIPICYRPNDSLSFACANAFAALEAGAAGIKTALTGETALRTDRFAAAFAVKAPALSLGCALQLTGIKSGVEALLRSVSASASRDAAPLNENTADIFLDAASRPGDVEAAVRSLGYELSPEDIGRVTDALHSICRKKSSVGAKELEAIVASSAVQVPSTYHLETYLISTGNLTASMASIHLTKNGETLTGVATGDGPIDSAFRAIEQCIGTHYELDEFRIEAVTEGKESLGAALVCLRNGGHRYAGNGISADIVGASIRAYISALNKIVYEEDRA